MSLRTGEQETEDTMDLFDRTGEHLERYKTIMFPFDRYEINVQLGSNNEFIGVVGVKLNKDFVDYEKKRMPLGYHDVDEFYKE
ncbi:MAG: hypothetical protein RBR63_03040 [Methanosarcina vacuolata]|jgi:hypothetical protein|nr:hypothetical protein [Methanosarcina vacuolata]